MKNILNYIDTHRHWVLVGIISFLSVVHFSLPMTITFDTSHYHTFLPIIDGVESLKTWDVARGPVFPHLISLIHEWFGYSHSGVVLGSWFFYVVSLLAIYFIAHRFFNGASTLFSILIVFLVGMDPIIVGYFHTLLTEFVAATFFLVSTAMAITWAKEPPSLKNWKFVGTSLGFIVLVPLAFHLKQPYVSSAIFPLLAALVFKVFTKEELMGKVFRGGIFVLCLGSLAASIVWWHNYLPEEAFLKHRGRSSQSFLYKQIREGIKSFQYVGMVSNFNGAKLKEFRFSESDRNEIQSLSTKEKACTRIWKGTSVDILGSCSADTSTSGAILFTLKTFKADFWGTLGAYWHSYTRVATYNKPRFEENKAIAERVYHDTVLISNAFWVTPALSGFIAPYKQNNSAKIGFMGRLPFKWFIGQSRSMYKVVGVAAPFILLLLVGLILLNRKYPVFTGLSEKLVVPLFIINASVSLHVGAHAYLDAIIDRYASPVFPMGYLGFLLFLGFALRVIKDVVPAIKVKENSEGKARA